MNHETTPRRARNGRLAMGAGLIAAGALAGGVLAGTLSASADSTPSPSTSASQSGSTDSQGGSTSGQSGTQTGPNGQQGPRGGHGGATPVRSDEKALSTADADKVKAAALAAVPGGTVYRVETDAGDGKYEAHMTKADGTLVTVKLDENFKVTAVEDGMGKGDPAPAGQQGTRSGSAPQGGQSGSAPSASASGTA